MRLKNIILIAMLVAASITGVMAAGALAGGDKDKCKKHPYKCQPPTTTTTTTPPPPRVCPDGKPPTPGEGAYDPNDDCARPPETPPETTPPPVVPPPVTPPPALNCPAGMTEISRTATQVVCGTVVTKTIVKTKTKTKVVVKKRTKFIEFCPKPRNGKKLTG